MKYFSKLLSMLLVGVVLVSTACTDYADDIANTNAQLGEVQADVEGILELLDKIECEHGDALDAIIAGHCDDLAGLAEDIADANDEILALKGVDADLKKSIEFINSLLKELAGEQDEEKLLSAMATWNALFDGLKVFYETQLEGLLSDVEAAKAFMAAMNETLNSYKATYSQKTGMTAVVEDLETVIAKFQALEKEFDQYKEDTAVEFSKVYAAIASLGSVQSIVYVPEYSDGCATINFAYINNKIVEARSTMEFMVTPASGAGKIVSMWTENPEVLAIVHEDLKERLNTRSAEHLFNVANVYVKNGEPDRLMVEFDTRHLEPAFYAGEKSYALSLVYNAGNEGDVTSEANVASCFVKAVVTTKPEVLNVAIVNAAKEVVTNKVGEDTHLIQYTNDPIILGYDKDGKAILQDIPVTLLNMHKVAFYTGDFKKDAYRTYEEMVEAGYDLTLENNVKPTDAAGYTKNYDCVKKTGEPLEFNGSVKDGSHEYHMVQIAKDYRTTQEYIGFVGTFKYNYILNTNYYDYNEATDPVTENDLTDPDFYSLSEVKITKKTVNINVKVEDPIVWTYTKDAKVDAYLYKNGPEAHYTRSFEVNLPPHRGEPVDDMPVDVNYHYFLENPSYYMGENFYYYNADVKCETEGATAALVHKPHTGGIADECKYELTINDFEWDKDYNVVLKYETPGVILFLTFEIQTVDRNRDVVVVDYEQYKEIVYHSNLSFEFTAKNDEVKNRFYAERVKDQAIHYDNEAAWLKDVFVTNNPEIAYNTVNMPETLVITENTAVNTWNDWAKNSDKWSEYTYTDSKLNLDLANNEIDVLYNYSNKIAVNNIVPDVLNYTMLVDTWYDQQFLVKKSIDFKTPDYIYAGIEPHFVYDTENGKATDARPHYDPRMPENWTVASWALNDFSIERVNLYAIFDLKKSHFDEETFIHLDRESCVPVSPVYESVQAVVTDKANVAEYKNIEQDVNFHLNNGDNLVDSNMTELLGVWYYKYEDTLKPVYTLADVKDTKHIDIYGGYAISYYGYDPEVNVDSKLYIVNNDGSMYAAESNFDNNFANTYDAACEDYSNYVVKQYNPLTKLVATQDSEVIKVSASDEPYKIYAGKAFSLKDKRGAELVNIAGTPNTAGDVDFLIWGNGTNGFADGVYAGWAFGFPTDVCDLCGEIEDNTKRENVKLEFDFSENNIPVQLEKFFTFHSDNGMIEFDYSPQAELKEEIRVKVKVKVTHSWNCNNPDVAETTFIFKQNQIL